MGAEDKKLPRFRYPADADESLWGSFRPSFHERNRERIARAARAKAATAANAGLDADFPAARGVAIGRPRLAAGEAAGFHRPAVADRPGHGERPNHEPARSGASKAGSRLNWPAAIAGFAATVVAGSLLIGAPWERAAQPPPPPYARVAVTPPPAAAPVASPSFEAAQITATPAAASPPHARAAEAKAPRPARARRRHGDKRAGHRWRRTASSKKRHAPVVRSRHAPSARRGTPGVQIDQPTAYPDQPGGEQTSPYDEQGPNAPPD